MSKRNFSLQAYWDKKAEEWTPLLSFRGTTAEEYAEIGRASCRERV